MRLFVLNKSFEVILTHFADYVNALTRVSIKTDPETHGPVQSHKSMYVPQMTVYIKIPIEFTFVNK